MNDRQFEALKKISDDLSIDLFDSTDVPTEFTIRCVAMHYGKLSQLIAELEAMGGEG